MSLHTLTLRTISERLLPANHMNAELKYTIFPYGKVPNFVINVISCYSTVNWP